MTDPSRPDAPQSSSPTVEEPANPAMGGTVEPCSDPAAESGAPAPPSDEPHGAPQPELPSKVRRFEGPRPKAVLVGIALSTDSDEDLTASLAELGRLADTLGLEVIGQVTQRRESLSVAAGIGGGKLIELARFTGGTGVVARYAPAGTERPELVPVSNPLPEEQRATVVLVDRDLSPRQTRNLELATDAEVLDRSMVVVSIFQRHARTREARLQVEIARLAYMAPRLREAGAGEDRQRGGVGGKGAGESSLELNRRQIRDRIAELRRELVLAQRTADTQRTRRNQSHTVAIVGYTNAGKSSLMRRLTGDSVYVADQLFATLDTTVRVLKPETKPPILVSDTVGFIRNLPHDLVASFRSTLQEASEAKVLMHLVDASDPAFADQMRVTEEVLADLDHNLGQSAADAPPPREPEEHLLVLNKADRLSEEQKLDLQQQYPEALLISAHNEQDVARLHRHLVGLFEQGMVEQTFQIPYSLQARVAKLHQHCRVVSETHDEQGTTLTVRAPQAVLGQLQRQFSRE